jgi:hypothetical protein
MNIYDIFTMMVIGSPYINIVIGAIAFCHHSCSAKKGYISEQKTLYRKVQGFLFYSSFLGSVVGALGFVQEA